ncbi:expressed unknown protein [Seminavis robusta]|uniref:Uncharacterized protein n=1 Tax=Seminavis robusta TaxID=568900 RepID=A0A9N8D7E2_9STRA|nr:expressed unknown protein [Seminavis robusta]|eukprot:Sro6_g005220.1 n/a (196) ;mRNA; f:127152-127739
MATTITTAPLKIISGGQTGADLAALIAAKAVGLETGGTASEGFQTEMGANVDLRRVYGLTAEGSYKARTKKNVDDADATIVLLVHEGKGGAAKTIGWASNQRWECQLHSKLHGGYRPVMVLKADDLEEEHLEESAMKIVQFVRLTGTRVLNVAGHRQSTAFMPEFFLDGPPYDYQKRCVDLLTLAFASVVRQATT